ncbi:MAG: hypothetical protein HDS83_02460 [Bacteroidales bacterium]|nr:hypothetical protein [Bacteroidales bacterium]
MAIKAIEQLKAYFKKGLYPTEEQFAHLIDSFRHKNDKVEIPDVEGLPNALNAKYDASNGVILEKIQQDLNDRVDHVEIVQESQSESIDKLKEKDRAICELIKEDAYIDEAHDALHALGDNYKSLYALAQTLKTFLETTDTKDTTINTWVEVENFLQGVTDTSSLTALLKTLETNITEAYKKAITDASPEEDIKAINKELAKARNLIKNDSTFDDSKTALETLGEEYKDLFALASTVKARFETPEEAPGNYVENVILENGSDIDADILINEEIGVTIFACQGNPDGTTVNFPEEAYVSTGDGFVVEFFNMGWGFYKQRLHRGNSHDTFERYTKPKGEWSEWINVNDSNSNIDVSELLTGYQKTADADSKYQPKGTYLTSHQDLSPYQKTADADNKYQPKGNYLTSHQSLAAYITAASADAKYQPKGNYLTSHQSLAGYLTTTAAANTYQPKGNYLTSHQSLSGYLKSWKGTIDQYKAIATKDSNTLYCIPE